MRINVVIENVITSRFCWAVFSCCTELVVADLAYSLLIEPITGYRRSLRARVAKENIGLRTTRYPAVVSPTADENTPGYIPESIHRRRNEEDPEEDPAYYPELFTPSEEASSFASPTLFTRSWEGLQRRAARHDEPAITKGTPAADHQRQVQLTMALKLLKGLQTQMAEFHEAAGDRRRSGTKLMLEPSPEEAENGTKEEGPQEPQGPCQSPQLPTSHQNPPRSHRPYLPPHRSHSAQQQAKPFFGSRLSEGLCKMLVECTTPDFLKCQPLNFKGTEGVVGLTRWFEKMESVFSISNCTIASQVKFATCTLHDDALTWDISRGIVRNVLSRLCYYCFYSLMLLMPKDVKTVNVVSTTARELLMMLRKFNTARGVKDFPVETSLVLRLTIARLTTVLCVLVKVGTLEKYYVLRSALTGKLDLYNLEFIKGSVLLYRCERSQTLLSHGQRSPKIVYSLETFFGSCDKSIVMLSTFPFGYLGVIPYISDGLDCSAGTLAQTRMNRYFDLWIVHDFSRKSPITLDPANSHDKANDYLRWLSRSFRDSKHRNDIVLSPGKARIECTTHFCFYSEKLAACLSTPQKLDLLQEMSFFNGFNLSGSTESSTIDHLHDEVLSYGPDGLLCCSVAFGVINGTIMMSRSILGTQWAWTRRNIFRPCLAALSVYSILPLLGVVSSDCFLDGVLFNSSCSQPGVRKGVDLFAPHVLKLYYWTLTLTCPRLSYSYQWEFDDSLAAVGFYTPGHVANTSCNSRLLLVLWPLMVYLPLSLLLAFACLDSIRLLGYNRLMFLNTISGIKVVLFPENSQTVTYHSLIGGDDEVPTYASAAANSVMQVSKIDGDCGLDGIRSCVGMVSGSSSGFHLIHLSDRSQQCRLVLGLRFVMASEDSGRDLLWPL
ncbi:hypothetical protein Tco_0046033 [Tanacetum coccineum]